MNLLKVRKKMLNVKCDDKIGDIVDLFAEELKSEFKQIEKNDKDLKNMWDSDKNPLYDLIENWIIHRLSWQVTKRKLKFQLEDKK